MPLIVVSSKCGWGSIRILHADERQYYYSTFNSISDEIYRKSVILTSPHLASGAGKSALPNLILYTNQCSIEDSHIATEAVNCRSAERGTRVSKFLGYQL